MKIYRANILHTPTADRFEIFEHGYIAVDDNGIIEGVYHEWPEHLRAYDVINFGDKLLVPAMNDLHVHAPQYRNMGLAMDLQLLPWLETYTFPEERKYANLKYARRMYKRFVRELWMQGTMRAVVFGTIHPEATQMLADIFSECGMGAYVGLVGMDRNCPDFLSNTKDELLAGMDAMREKATDLVHPILTPRFVPTCSDEMLSAMGQYAKRYNMPVQSHLSENPSEIAWVRELQPKASTYAGAYDIFGLFGDTPTLMAHCCYSEGEELELLRRKGVMVVHCPTSNCNLASGIAPIRRFLNAGIPVALGTDVSGGHHASILRVLHYAIQVSKLHNAYHREDAPLSFPEAFHLATKVGGSFFGKVGSFEPGYEFDALLINDDYLNFDHYTLEERIERYIYLGDDRDIRLRFCRGKIAKEPVLEDR